MDSSWWCLYIYWSGTIHQIMMDVLEATPLKTDPHSPPTKPSTVLS